MIYKRSAVSSPVFFLLEVRNSNSKVFLDLGKSIFGEVVELPDITCLYTRCQLDVINSDPGLFATPASGCFWENVTQQIWKFLSELKRAIPSDLARI